MFPTVMKPPNKWVCQLHQSPSGRGAVKTINLTFFQLFTWDNRDDYCSSDHWHIVGSQHQCFFSRTFRNVILKRLGLVRRWLGKEWESLPSVYSCHKGRSRGLWDSQAANRGPREPTIKNQETKKQVVHPGAKRRVYVSGSVSLIHWPLHSKTTCCFWFCSGVALTTLWLLQTELPYDPAIPLLGIYPERTFTEKATCTPMFVAALFAVAKTWKQPKCPMTDKWIKKMWCIYTMEYYSAIKKNKSMPFAATWMELQTLILSQVRKRKTDTIWYYLHVESKIWTNDLSTKQKQIMDLEDRLVFARGEGEGVGWFGSLGLVDKNRCI